METFLIKDFDFRARRMPNSTKFKNVMWLLQA
jgi:hypothetical protein